MDCLYCACCGRPFRRTSQRGPAPLYCSPDCRRQIAVRRRAWAGRTAALAAGANRSPGERPAGRAMRPAAGQ